MRRGLFLRLFGVIGLSQLVWTANKLAGDSRTGGNPEPPQTVNDLINERKGKLNKSIIDIFKRAVAYHRTQRYEEAWAEYAKLCLLPIKGGKFYDLRLDSKVFRHNLELLGQIIAVLDDEKST